MPPKKPAVKGPFFFFMLDFRRKEECKGKSFPGGMDQVMREAGPHWNLLNEDQREAYKDRAKAYKQAPKMNYGEKYTAQGIPFSIIEKEQQERLKKQETIRKAIAEMIETAKCNNALEKMKVYFISFNSFCKTTKDVFVPAEMAMIEYNLELGVLNKLHELINPGKLPLGLAYESIQLSEATHQLPIPPDAIGENDYGALLDKLLQFTDYNNKPFKLFLLMTDAKEVPEVESILKQLTDESKLTYQFLVCPLGEFFFQLKRATESYGLDICTFPAKTVADILLRKDTYEYTSGIACAFHEKLGIPKYCALSRVIRWSYTISDSCCLDLSIDLIAGRHLPMNADTTLCSNMSDTGGTSFVSSSDLTHVSMPKIQKIRSKSPFGGLEDENGSVIYSSRAGIVKDYLKREKPDMNMSGSTVVSTNPFHSVDVKGSNHQSRPGGPDQQSTKESKIGYNPFSRRHKMEEVRQPRSVQVVGHGRGALLGNAASGSAISGASSFFKGAGRGAGFFNALFSSADGASSVNSFQTNDD